MPRNTIISVFPLLLILLSIASSTWGFTAAPIQRHWQTNGAVLNRHAAASSAGGDSDEIIARKIVVCGDVDGGYYRSCVKNEVCVFTCYEFCMHILCTEKKISDIFLSLTTCFSLSLSLSLSLLYSLYNH